MPPAGLWTRRSRRRSLDAFFTRILNSAGMEALSLFGNHAFDRPAVCLTPFDFSTLMIFRSGKEAFEALLSPEHAAMLTATHKTALTTPGIGSEGIAKALQAFLARLDGPPKPPTPTAADEAEANARLAEELGEVEDRGRPRHGGCRRALLRASPEGARSERIPHPS
jgi:hypothetical protein